MLIAKFNFNFYRDEFFICEDLLKHLSIMLEKGKVYDETND